MTPPNRSGAPDHRWSTTSHGIARAWPTYYRPNVPDKSSRDASGRHETSPQPHPEWVLQSPKPGYATAAIIAAPVKSP
jgi:hypothetical protein